jgi:hypothetical protein
LAVNLLEMPSLLPVATLAIQGAVKSKGAFNGRSSSPAYTEPVYGGYANGRGEIVLFAKDLAYHVNFKNRILKERPPLNPGAQARYDTTEPGESFEYGTKSFQRLSSQQIQDIYTTGDFRVGSRF